MDSIHPPPSLSHPPTSSTTQMQLHLTLPLQQLLTSSISLLPPELALQIIQALAEKNEIEDDADEDDRGEGRKTREERLVSHDLLISVGEWAKGQKEEIKGRYRLSSLLRLTDIYAPPLLVREKSAALLSILASIQLSQDRLLYTNLTTLLPSSLPHSLLPLNDIHASLSLNKMGNPKSEVEEWADVKREVGAIVNVLISMIACGAGVWWVGGGRSYALRLALAFGGAIIIGSIESFLYYRSFTRSKIVPKLMKKGAMGVLMGPSSQEKVLKFD